MPISTANSATRVRSEVGEQAMACAASSHDHALPVKVRLAFLLTADILTNVLSALHEGHEPTRTLENAIIHLVDSADMFREDDMVSGVFLGAVDDLRSLL